MTDISISASPRKPINVTLVGVKYRLTPPKAALAIRIAREAKKAGDDAVALLDILDTWLVKAFGKETAAAIQARLEDDDDDLDFPHINQLLEAVIERTAAGNPTT